VPSMGFARIASLTNRANASIAGFIVAVLAAHVFVPARAQTADDSLRIYAVNVVKTPPFEKQFTGYGIYLGRGMVITAAHVVGHWPFFTRPRVLIGGQDLAAKVLKEGSFGKIDLALLSVEEARLPVSLRLRRTPLCKDTPKVGTQVIDVVPEGTSRSRIISPLSIAPEFRRRFGTLIDTEESSGSGLFEADRKCFFGIVSAKIRTPQIVSAYGVGKAGFAAYFVPGSQIAKFIPSNLGL
jgi:hypothetical protein